MAHASIHLLISNPAVQLDACLALPQPPVHPRSFRLFQLPERDAPGDP